MFQKEINKIKKKFRQTAKTQVSDHRIGISFAVGTFIALLPFSVFALAIGLAVALIFKYIHKLSLFLALLFWNGLWNAVLLIPALRVGHFVVGNYKPFESIPYIGKILTGTQYYIIGISTIGLYLAILSYFVIRLLIKLYRIRKEKLKHANSNS